MTHIIYTVAIGSKYQEQARELGVSLRTHGYDGRLLAIAETPVDGWELLAVTQEQLDTLRMSGASSPLLKTFPEALGDVTGQADRVTYLDADVRCVAPLGTLLDGPGIAVQNGGTPLVGHGTANMTPSDMSRLPPNPWSVGPGMVSFPGGKIGRKFLDLWNYEAESRRLHDGSALAVVLYRAFPSFTFLPEVSFSHSRKASDKLVHYVGGSSPTTTTSKPTATAKPGGCGCSRAKRDAA